MAFSSQKKFTPPYFTLWFPSTVWPTPRAHLWPGLLLYVFCIWYAQMASYWKFSTALIHLQIWKEASWHCLGSRLLTPTFMEGSIVRIIIEILFINKYSSLTNPITVIFYMERFFRSFKKICKKKYQIRSDPIFNLFFVIRHFWKCQIDR